MATIKWNEACGPDKGYENVLYQGDQDVTYGGAFYAPQRHGYCNVLKVEDPRDYGEIHQYFDGVLIQRGDISSKTSGNYDPDTRKFKFTTKHIREVIECGWKPNKWSELTKLEKDVCIYANIDGYWGINVDCSWYVPSAEQCKKVNRTKNHRKQPRRELMEKAARDLHAELETLEDYPLDRDGMPNLDELLAVLVRSIEE